MLATHNAIPMQHQSSNQEASPQVLISPLGSLMLEMHVPSAGMVCRVMPAKRLELGS